MSDLKKRALELLRDKRLSEGDCYHGVDNLAKELGCTPKELFDWDTDSGVLMELSDEGEVGIACGSSDPSAIACMDDPWRRY